MNWSPNPAFDTDPTRREDALTALKSTASGLSTTPEKEHAARLQHALADLEDGKPSE